jgi:hypothetical protein
MLELEITKMLFSGRHCIETGKNELGTIVFKNILLVLAGNMVVERK